MKHRLNETSRGYSSNARIFENRGDPWVSDREGREGYGRTDDELPDLDAYWRATKALTRDRDRSIPVVKPPLSERDKALLDYARKTADIGNRLRNGVRIGGF